jgi:hypothetical protein
MPQPLRIPVVLVFTVCGASAAGTAGAPDPALLFVDRAHAGSPRDLARWSGNTAALRRHLGDAALATNRLAPTTTGRADSQPTRAWAATIAGGGKQLGGATAALRSCAP